MKIGDIMNRRIAKILHTATMAQAAEIAALTEVSDLMVVDENGDFVGLLAEGDLIRAVLPDVDEIFSAGGSHDDAYQAFLASGQDLARQSIDRLIITHPVLLHPDDQLLKAATVMVTRHMRRLAVVDNGRLVGTVSRADICWGLLAMGENRASEETCSSSSK